MIGLLLAAALADQPADDLRTVEAVRQLQNEVSRVRRLPFLLDVDVAVRDAARVRQDILEDELDDEARALLAQSELSMRAFRLIDADFDLEALFLDIMEQHLGGFYDPETRELVLVRRDDVFTSGRLDSGSEESQVASHELVHALQDQHFDLWNLRNRDFHDDDVETAIVSLIEGDASFAMTWFTYPGMTRYLDTMDLGLTESLFRDQTGGGALGEAPRPLRDAIMFPYMAGTEFVQRIVHKRGWEGVNAAMGRPPMSTEQILHPERYLGPRPDWPTRLEIPDLAPILGSGWNHVATNGLGELGIRSLLHAQTSMPQVLRHAAAAGWDGDRYSVLQHDDGALAMAWCSTWDSRSDAMEFTRVIERWVEEVLGEEASKPKVGRFATTWTTPSATWAVRVDGRDVTVLADVPHRRVRPMLTALDDLPRRTLKTVDDVAPPKDEPRASAP